MMAVLMKMNGMRGGILLRQKQNLSKRPREIMMNCERHCCRHLSEEQCTTSPALVLLCAEFIQLSEPLTKVAATRSNLVALLGICQIWGLESFSSQTRVPISVTSD